MNRYLLIPIIILTCIIPKTTNAQVDGEKMGAWYMYFWNTSFGESNWGLQGDIQHRNWDLGGDLEQLLLRGGLTYTPRNTSVKFTLGYGNITTGAFGESSSTTSESRIYQEALLPQKVGSRVYLTHRFRYEQRWVESQDFRTRWRYNIFMNIPLNNSAIIKGTFYLALYNELFINDQRDIGDGRTVELFDRNRTYGALGYALSEKMKIQMGIMKQTTDGWEKYQMQLSLHHNW